MRGEVTPHHTERPRAHIPRNEKADLAEGKARQSIGPIALISRPDFRAYF